MRILKIGLRLLLVASLATALPDCSSGRCQADLQPVGTGPDGRANSLFSDSLLSQILMASTYPVDVAEASKWSKANPGQEGDAAVTAVQEKSWDPSVDVTGCFPPGAGHDG